MKKDLTFTDFCTIFEAYQAYKSSAQNAPAPYNMLPPQNNPVQIPQVVTSGETVTAPAASTPYMNPNQDILNRIAALEQARTPSMPAAEPAQTIDDVIAKIF